MAALPSTTDAAKKSGPLPPREQPPQPGDILVFADTPHAGEAVTPEALQAGDTQRVVWPMAADTRELRDGARFNQILVLKVADAGSLDASVRDNAAGDIVAFSAVCTHAGCVVTLWSTDEKALHCPCHGSRFDPRQGGKVVGGPAPRRLAMLPITVANGAIVVAGPFTGSLGPPAI